VILDYLRSKTISFTVLLYLCLDVATFLDLTPDAFSMILDYLFVCLCLDGAYFLDSNPDVFSVILDYLRYKTLIMNPAVPVEAVKVKDFSYLPVLFPLCCIFPMPVLFF
jgi:hypothetical protein